MHFIDYKVNFRNSIRKFLFFLNVYSIDIALAGVSGFITVNKVFGLPQNLALIVLLFLGIFLIYWLDHLLDIRKYGNHLSSRHFLISKKQTLLYKIGFVFILISGMIAFFYLSIKALLLGLLLLVLSLLYLALNATRYVPKEIFAASVYTVGIYFQVILNPGLYEFLVIGYFFGLTLYAMYGIAWIEKATDKRYGVPNGVTTNKISQTMFLLLFVTGIVSVIITSAEIYNQLIVSYLFVLVVLKSIFALCKMQRYQCNWYRIAIEWSFLIPWLWI